MIEPGTGAPVLETRRRPVHKQIWDSGARFQYLAADKCVCRSCKARSSEPCLNLLNDHLYRQDVPWGTMFLVPLNKGPNQGLVPLYTRDVPGDGYGCELYMPGLKRHFLGYTFLSDPWVKAQKMLIAYLVGVLDNVPRAELKCSCVWHTDTAFGFKKQRSWEYLLDAYYWLTIGMCAECATDANAPEKFRGVLTSHGENIVKDEIAALGTPITKGFIFIHSGMTSTYPTSIWDGKVWIPYDAIIDQRE